MYISNQHIFIHTLYKQQCEPAIEYLIFLNKIIQKQCLKAILFENIKMNNFTKEKFLSIWNLLTIHIYYAK